MPDYNIKSVPPVISIGPITHGDLNPPPSLNAAKYNNILNDPFIVNNINQSSYLKCPNLTFRPTEPFNKLIL